MKKAIVTGATGAVGTALVNKLISKGVETLVLVRKGGRVNKIPSNPLVKIAYCSLDEMADFQNENVIVISNTEFAKVMLSGDSGEGTFKLNKYSIGERQIVTSAELVSFD